jgi:type I restriction enzyme S subunit
MASEWQKIRLGDYCSKIGSGATPRGGKDVYLTQGVTALFRSQNVRNEGFSTSGLVYIEDFHAEELSNVVVESGDVLLNITGDSVARSCLAPEQYLPARVNQHVAIIRPDIDRLDPYFLRYVMVSPQQQELMLGLAASGATRNALTKSMIEDFRITLPPLEVQRLVGRTLKALEDKIAVLQSTNELLEAIARAIFKSWFVDFEPVRAKAEGREPDGMDSDTAALFPSEFQDSPLGEIPNGWSVRTVGDVSISNRHSIGRNYTNTEIEYVDISAVEPGKVSSTTVYALSDAPSRAKRLVNDGDVIWSCVRPNRRSYALILEPSERLVVSTGFVTLTATEVPFSFLYCSVTTNEFVEYLTMRADGAAYPAVRPDTFESAKLVIPSPDIAVIFNEITEPLLRKCEANRRLANTLSDLRDTLLPRLISGKLRVPEAEKMLEAVL